MIVVTIEGQDNILPGGGKGGQEVGSWLQL
jgi:hypothetical protein